MVLPKRVVVWERVDAAVSEALLTAGGQARRAVQSMIDLAVQGGGGGGVSAADRQVLAAVRRRSAADEAAPTATNWGPRPAGFGAVFAIGAAPAPDDAMPGDLHILPPPAAGSTATTTFTLADGSAWPTPWQVERVPVGGGATVAGGMGRLSSGATGGYASPDTVAARYGVAVADSEVLLTFRLVTSDAFPALVLRSDQANLDPGTGVVLSWTKTGLKAETVQQYTYAQVGSAVKAHTVGVDYRLRVSCTGGSLMARTWPLADPEPATWDITATIPTGVAGYQGLTVGSGQAAAAQTVAFDDIAFTSGAGGYGTAYGLAYGIS